MRLPLSSGGLGNWTNFQTLSGNECLVSFSEPIFSFHGSIVEISTDWVLESYEAEHNRISTTNTVNAMVVLFV